MYYLLVDWLGTLFTAKFLYVATTRARIRPQKDSDSTVAAYIIFRNVYLYIPDIVYGVLGVLCCEHCFCKMCFYFADQIT